MKDLREFIKKLEENGELLRITQQVSCQLEIAEITDRISKKALLEPQKNKAILFENIENYNMPVLINSMGSLKRLNLALNINSLDELTQEINYFLNINNNFNNLNNNFLSSLKTAGKLAGLARFLPQKFSGKTAPCQEIIITDKSQKMLDKLPILKCWPKDAGEFITLPLVFTKDPVTGARNIGMYRLQKYSNTETGFHVHPNHDGNLENNNINNKKIEIAVAIGADPALVYSATAPLPKGIDEAILAGFLNKQAVKFVKCKTVDLEVPAYAEIILEGYVDLEDLRTEGPFGDHTGFYSPAELFPTFKLTAITHRKEPIYMTTIVGIPPQEDCYLGKLTERIFLPVLQKILPEVCDINMPFEGVFHNCIIISMNKKFLGHPQKVMNAVWGLGQLCTTKYIIILDSKINIHDLNQVAFAVLSNTDPKRDFLFSQGALDILDHGASTRGFGSKLGIDATEKPELNTNNKTWPEIIDMSQDIKNLVSNKFNYLF